MIPSPGLVGEHGEPHRHRYMWMGGGGHEHSLYILQSAEMETKCSSGGSSLGAQIRIKEST